MNSIVKRLLGESFLDKVLPVIVSTKTTDINVCPHCRVEICEKHTYTDDDPLGEHVDRHSDCGGAIKFPPPSPEAQAWLDRLRGGAR